MASPLSRRRRVRTGCLTCRARKIKCDEARPFCDNCIRVDRACLYQSPRLSHHCYAPAYREELARSLSEAQSSLDADVQVQVQEVTHAEAASGRQDLSEASTLDTGLDYPIFDEVNDDLTSFDFITGEWGDLFPGTGDTLPQPTITPTPAANPATFVPEHDTQFTWFLQHAEPPFVTPWDSANWILIKNHACHLGRLSSAVADSIRAIEGLYESLLSDKGNTGTSLQRYFSAKSSYLSLLEDQTSDIETVLVATFLLCCFEIAAQHETVPNTLKQKGVLVTRLEKEHEPWSPVSGRMICWLHLFHTKALHMGGRGVLSPRLVELLQPPHTLLPLTSLCPNPPLASDVSLQALQQPLFSFFFELQQISAQVSGFNRHHRPRGGLEDERHVDKLSGHIRKRLDFLWQGRPRLLDLPMDQLPQVVSDTQALDDLKLIIRLCIASFYAELIYHARGHGKFPPGSTCINDARHNIKGVITDALQDGESLHPAYLWPLFMFAAESTVSKDVQWAIERLSGISNALWSSSSITDLGRELTKKQLHKGERVDSRYLCMQSFGVLPPFM